MKKRKRSGSTKECLLDFFRRTTDRGLFEEFTGVSARTLRRWKASGPTLAGETLLRVQYFLMFAGYEITEFQNLHVRLIALGKCFALGIITLARLTEILGLDQVKRIYYVFRGERGVSSTHDYADQFLADQSANIAVREEEVVRKLSALLLDQEQTDSELITEFQRMCQKTRLLAQKLLDGPVAQRVAMRVKMGTGQDPDLHCTWELLGQLLREKTNHES